MLCLRNFVMLYIKNKKKKKKKNNFQKLFQKHSLYMQATSDDGLWKVRKRSRQFW